jgi:hypothetical protein
VLRCANPVCGKTLASSPDLHTIEFEIVSISVAISDDESTNWDESPKREATRVFLCAECASTVSVKVGPKGITILPPTL